MPIWFGVAVTGLLRARTYEWFLRAELLGSTGRDQEALGWYAGFTEGAPPDLVYLGPAHLRRAEILERQGRLPEAVAEYRKFVALWRDCDPELRPAWQAARHRLALLGGASGQR